MANPAAQVPMTTTPYADEKTRRDLAATAQTYYPGEAIAVDSAGNETKCDDAAVLVFDGFVADGTRITVDSGDAAGDKKVYAQRPRFATVKASAAAATDIGRPCWWAFSNEIQYVPGTNANFAGYVHRYISATEVEIELTGPGGPELVAVSMLYDAASVDRCYFTADRRYQVVNITGRVDVLGTDVGSVTAVVKKAASATNIASGTALHTGTFNLKGTDETNQVLTLEALANISIAAGSSIGIDFTGTLTSALGLITAILAPWRK